MDIKDIKQILFVLGAILIILIGMLAFTFTEKDITGEVIKEYKYTTAVCNENNLCQDYEIICQGKKVVDITPTGFIVQNSKDWKDPRDSKDIEQWCNISE